MPKIFPVRFFKSSPAPDNKTVIPISLSPSSPLPHVSPLSSLPPIDPEKKEAAMKKTQELFERFMLGSSLFSFPPSETDNLPRYAEGSGDPLYYRGNNTPLPPAIVIDPQIEELEKTLFELFGTKCEVFALFSHGKNIRIKFALDTTDTNLKSYAAILMERKLDVTELRPPRSLSETYPSLAELVLEHSSITELRAKLGCEQQLMKCPGEREQQLVPYSPH